MPPKGRRDPSLLVGPDGQPDTSPEALSIEETEEQGGQTEPGEIEEVGPTLMFDGELLQTSMTLAVLLPGDNKESYFGARFVGRLQPGEPDDNLVSRAIVTVREAVISAIDDAVDAIAEYQQTLAERLK